MGKRHESVVFLWAKMYSRGATAHNSSKDVKGAVVMKKGSRGWRIAIAGIGICGMCMWGSAAAEAAGKSYEMMEELEAGTIFTLRGV